MIKKLTSNIGWKILALLLASLLWLTVVNLEDPQVTTTIRGITVQKLNENEITSQKQAIQYVAGNTVDVKVKGKRSIVYRLKANDIEAYADMKNLSITGAVDIQLEVPNDIEVLSKAPASVSVKLERIITKQMEVSYEKLGKVKAGYVDLSPIITPGNIELEAAESIIYKIAKVVVPVDIKGISNDLTISVAPQFYDHSGFLVTGDVTASTKQVEVRVPVEKTKTVPLRFEPQGEVKDGYRYMGNIISDSSVSIRGKDQVIDHLQEIVIGNISVEDMTETQVVSVNLAKLLPDGINLNQDRSTVEVEIKIEPIITREFSFLPSEIQIHHLKEEKQITILSPPPILVTYKGVQSEIENLTKEDLKPSISVEDLSDGSHQVTIEWFIPEGMEIVSPKPIIELELKDRVEPEDSNNLENNQ